MLPERKLLTRAWGAERRVAFSLLLIGVVLLVTVEPVAAAQKPALLVVSPQGTANGWVDLGYLADLHQAGFEVDYTDSLAEVTWDRLHRYNVLVLYTCPADDGMDVWPFRRRSPISKEAYIELIDRFLAAGGGGFLLGARAQTRAT